MGSAGHRPDVGVLNLAMEVLQRSGVLPAQHKALQLFQAAQRQGQLRWACQALHCELHMC